MLAYHFADFLVIDRERSRIKEYFIIKQPNV